MSSSSMTVCYGLIFVIQCYCSAETGARHADEATTLEEQEEKKETRTSTRGCLLARVLYSLLPCVNAVRVLG